MTHLTWGAIIVLNKMLNKLKEKSKLVWDWIKKQTKKILIGLGIVSVAIAATVLPPEPIPADLLLKVDKTKILESKEVDWIEIQSDGTLINKGRIISYAYISDKEVLASEGEDLSKRTGNTQFFKQIDILSEGKKIAEKWNGRFHIGTPFFYMPDKGKWYQTEVATTTINAFNQQTASTIFEKLLVQEAFALTTTTYTGAGDGHVGKDDDSNWNTTHNATDGTVSNNVATTLALFADVNTGIYRLYRVFIPVDTSALPDNADISAGVWTLTPDTISTPDSIDFYFVGDTTQASTSTLSTADFDTCGATHSPTLYSAIFDGNDYSAGTAYNFTLNAAGISSISKTGFTMQGIREANDVDDVAPTTASVLISFRSSEYAGTASDPYLEITYTIAAEVIEAPIPQQVIIFE